MLVQSLVGFAQDNADRLPPMYYRPRPIDWVLLITHQGTRAQLSRRPGRSSTDRRPVELNTPYAARSGTRPPPSLIVDTAQFVLGVPAADKKTGTASEAAVAEAERRHEEYLDLLRRWAASDPGPGPAADLLRFLDETGLGRVALPDGLEASHTVALLVDTRWLHELPSARAFWSDEVSRRKSGKSAQGICLACNTSGTLLDTIPVDLKPGLIPGGGSTGPKLISVNKAAHGRDGVTSGLAGTPICEPCGAHSMSALNHLLADEEHRHRGPDYTLIWWTRPTAPDPGIAQLNELEPDPAHIAHLLDSLNDRPRPVSLRRADSTAFYGLTLSTNNGRVVVRDWLDVPLEDIKANLGAWYAHTRVWDGWRDTYWYQPVWLLTASTGRYDATAGRYLTKSALDGLENQLMHTAIRNTPPPARVLPNVLRRIQSDGRLDPVRTALIRLSLSRSTRGPMPDKLDTDLTEAAYLSGRTFAILEEIQRKALPDVNATIADKHLGQAMRSPGTAFPGLRINAQAHLKRLRRDKPGAYFRLNEALSQSLERLDHRQGGIPLVLDIQGQGMFLLGYEQQRAADFAAKRAAKAATT
ncbi:type I-C CRISPR-associated protein Cas8c/Csd1 [Streptomyces mayteni]